MATFDIETLMDALADAVVVIDDSGTLRWGNSANERMFGWSIADRVGTSALDLVHPDDIEVALLAMISVTNKSVGTPLELRIDSSSGWRLVEMIGVPYPGDELPGGVILSMRDLTERRRWEVAGDDDSRFRALIQNGATLTMLVDDMGAVMSASAAMTRQLGLDVEQVITTALTEFVVEGHRPILTAAFARARERSDLSSDERRVSCEVEMIHAAGHSVPFQLSIVDLLDDPSVRGLVVSGQDITELHATRVQLAHTASHDSLTGIPNRAAITDHLSQVLEMLGPKPNVAVAFVDLDRFKPVNDLFGHEAGDALLTAVAGRLQGALRAGDVVGRFGGDEFVVVAAVDNLSKALLMVERLERSLKDPFRLNCGTVQIDASVGVAMAGVESTADSLLAEADAAMYSVKYGRRGVPQNSRYTIGERRALAESLKAGFEREEFVVHYQPIVDLASKTVYGFEALVRWNHPELGLLLPGKFLDVVEGLGNEIELGEIVLKRALLDLPLMEHSANRELHMNINVAAAQLTDHLFPDRVASALASAGVSADRLTMEVSERTILERSTQGPSTPVLAGICALKELGLTVAADDFGTGYSSLTHLVSFPIDSLKIDRSFVSGILFDNHRRSIVSALVALAKGMKIDVVAEGVESPSQEEFLRDLGCRKGQGFLYGRGLSLDDTIRGFEVLTHPGRSL